MERFVARRLLLPASLMIVMVPCGAISNAQSVNSAGRDQSDNPPTTEQIIEKVDQLVQQNELLEKQNRELMDQIAMLRRALAGEPVAAQAAQSAQADAIAEALRAAVAEEVRPDAKLYSESGERPGLRKASFSWIKKPLDSSGLRAMSAGLGQDSEGETNWGTYKENLGFKVAETERGDLNISIYTYARYLNQRALQPTYTNAFGVTTTLQRRQDFQLNKVQIKFLGWILSQKFRYFLYGWSSNATQGQGAQVVLAGNLNYTFNKYFAVGSGIYSLPGTRSVEGNFPFWLSVDSRLITDEYMRPSYSTGVKVSGTVAKGLVYQSMIANNLSTLGVSAAQLPNYFQTNATALVWMPTTGEFGAGFGDYENHQKAATRLGGHFTYSKENKQSQPGTNDPDNTQLRLSDGSIIFTPNLFGPGIAVSDAIYKMTCFDGGIKYHGYALEGEFYLHWLSNFQGPGTSVLHSNFDRGYQLQASAMAVQKTLQGYVGGSEVIGDYGRPWDFRVGVNYFPYKNRVIRWNTEFLYLYRSPVGYTSVPFAVGGTGPIFYTTLEMAF